MYSWRIFTHDLHDWHFIEHEGASPKAAAFLISIGRALSTAGDMLFRVVAAVWAFEQTRSAALTGLIIVLPGVAGILCRGRIFSGGSVNPLYLLLTVEFVRATLYLLLALAPQWALILLVMGMSGAIQSIFEGAFAGFIGERVELPFIRWFNSLIKLATLCGTLLALACLSYIQISLSMAATLNGISFLVSAASCIAMSFVSQSTQFKNAARKSQSTGPTNERRRCSVAYLGASLGLALAAPSMVQISLVALPMVGAHPTLAYALYEAAVVAGSFLGIFLTLRLTSALTRQHFVGLALLINGALILGCLQNSTLFLIAVLFSALAEMMVVVDLQTRYQAELTTSECEEEVMRLRALIALMVGIGFTGNLLLQKVLDPLFLLALGSFVGLGSTTAALWLARDKTKMK